jgi:hypothetical protein
MELFTYSHRGQRPYQFFQKEADQQMQVRLGATLPRYDPKTVHEALLQFMSILTNDLEQLTNGQVHLTKAHVELLNAIRSRQSELEF